MKPGVRGPEAGVPAEQVGVWDSKPYAPAKKVGASGQEAGAPG